MPAPAPAPAPAEKSLYERLGGKPAIEAVVNEFVTRTTTDPRIKERFFNVDADNLKKLLVEKGTTFDNAFVTNPVCCPSRATILRGQYAHNHQVLHNQPPLGGAERFRSSGDDEKATHLRQPLLSRRCLARGVFFFHPTQREWCRRKRLATWRSLGRRRGAEPSRGL